MVCRKQASARVTETNLYSLCKPARWSVECMNRVKRAPWAVRPPAPSGQTASGPCSRGPFLKALACAAHWALQGLGIHPIIVLMVGGASIRLKSPCGRRWTLGPSPGRILSPASTEAEANTVARTLHLTSELWKYLCQAHVVDATAKRRLCISQPQQE
ncbi:unnamed protein product [Gadus morhua 'NCC']